MENFTVNKARKLLFIHFTINHLSLYKYTLYYIQMVKYPTKIVNSSF